MIESLSNLVLKKRTYLLYQTIVYQLTYFILLRTEWSALYQYSMYPSLYSVQGRQGMKEIDFYEKIQLRVHFVLFIYQNQLKKLIERLN